jgi:hypothetical protein
MDAFTINMDPHALLAKHQQRFGSPQATLSANTLITAAG